MSLITPPHLQALVLAHWVTSDYQYCRWLIRLGQPWSWPPTPNQSLIIYVSHHSTKKSCWSSSYNRGNAISNYSIVKTSSIIFCDLILYFLFKILFLILPILLVFLSMYPNYALYFRTLINSHLFQAPSPDTPVHYDLPLLWTSNVHTLYQPV